MPETSNDAFQKNQAQAYRFHRKPSYQEAMNVNFSSQAPARPNPSIKDVSNIYRIYRSPASRPDAIYTIRSYQTTHGVTYLTAHCDLTDLYQRGLLDRHKAGKQYRFVPVTERLMELFDSL